MHIKDYKELYFELFNKITDTIENLKKIQREAEEKFIASGENSSVVIDK